MYHLNIIAVGNSCGGVLFLPHQLTVNAHHQHFKAEFFKAKQLINSNVNLGSLNMLGYPV